MIKGEYKNFGFIPPSIKETDYFLGQGNLPRIVLETNGDWTDALPIIETQIRNNIDSINCTGFAITNKIEMYEYKAFGERNNYSDRWVALISGTTPQGNNPSDVYEAIRRYGLVPEVMCPWSDDIQSIDEYLSWKGVDKEACFREGLKWKERKDFMHNWVFRATQPLDEKLNNMKVALKYSPLAFDVEAWEKNADGKYIRLGLSGHWTTCYNIGEFIDVFDSYDPYLKQLVKDYNFFYCKRISITKKLNIVQKKSIWELIKAFLFGHDEEIKKLEPLLKPQEIDSPSAPTAMVEPTKEPESPKLKWAFPSDARKSVRILCDEMGLTVAEKNLICKVIDCESRFKINAKNENKDETGKVLSTDWGICQINDYYHIGAGKSFPSVQFVLENPEASIRFMLKMFKAGKLNLWVCYKAGLYQKYSG